MTPPRDEDATSDNFATVIRLRPDTSDIDAPEPSQTSEPDARGIWDLDAPLPGLPERPSVWEQPAATELFAPAIAAAPPAETSGSESTIVIAPRAARFPRVARQRLSRIAVVVAVLATAAIVAALAPSVGHPHTTHAAAKAPRHSATNTTPVKTKPGAHAHRSAVKAAATAPSGRHRRTRRVHHAAVTVREHRSPTIVPATSTSPVAAQTSTTTVQNVVAPPPSVAPASKTATSSCVPGELGC